MSLRFWPHSHNWITIGLVFNPPHEGAMRARNVSDITIERITYGFTNTSQRCEKCGRLRVVTSIGKTLT